MRAQDKESDSNRGRTGAGRRSGSAGASGPAAGLLALQRTAGNAAVARAVEEQRHEHDGNCGHGPSVQRSAVHEILRSPGRPLDAGLQTEMEGRFGGTDFSGVRLHTDAAALRSAAEIGAKAYTSAPHVVWDGKDKHTLAHELGHIEQQAQGTVPGTDNGSGLSISNEGDWAEVAAEQKARQVMSGVPPVQRATEENGAGTADSGTSGGPAPVQRALDPEVIQDAQEKLGVKGTVKIVEVPDSANVRADTPFADYPPGSCIGLSAEDLQLSVQALNGGEGQQPASAVVGLAGGGAYIASHKILLVNSTPSPGFTVEQTIRHEMGHVQQDKAGFNVDMSGGRRALVEYHNILVNENQFAPEDDPRHQYSSADNSLPTQIREAMAGVQLVPTKPWESLVGYIAGNDRDGSQKRLLDAIVEELNKEEYSAEQGRNFSRAPIRKKIQDRIGRFYFTELFKPAS